MKEKFKKDLTKQNKRLSQLLTYLIPAVHNGIPGQRLAHGRHGEHGAAKGSSGDDAGCADSGNVV